MYNRPVMGQHSRVPVQRNPFPSTIQFAPSSSGVPKEQQEQLPVVGRQQQSIQDIINGGFSNFWIYNFSGDGTRNLLEYAVSKGMFIDYMTSGFEGFGRYAPPSTSVYAPQYAAEVKKRIDSGLAPIKNVKHIYSVFPFVDEPFHAGPESFDTSVYAKARFRDIYGYPMPAALDSVRNDPRQWLDLLNFQSNTFRDGWTQVYHAMKNAVPGAKIVMTHDSHNTFGGGVKSNSRIAMDDVFHWGGNFADVLAYDMYPYMTFDYRYGAPGKLRKPRISQMHYTIAQLRNVATTYGKELGFWVGTYCDNWFSRFKGPERKSQYWFEQEVSYTAIAQGANYLISTSNYNGSNLPIDTLHWENYSAGMKLIQKAGAGLLKAPKLKSNACFLFPRTQYLQLQEEYFNVGLSFELFLRAFGELDIIHEEQITDDKLNGYKVLVLADVKLLPLEVARHIEAFVKKGGVVIADCVPQMDAHKQPLQVMPQLFGVSRAGTDRIVQQGQWVPFTMLPPKLSFPPEETTTEEIKSDEIKGTVFGAACNFRVTSPRIADITTATPLLTMHSGAPALLRSQAGKGKAYLLGFCLQDTYFQTWKNEDSAGRRQLRELVANIFRDAAVYPHIHSSNPDIEASVRASKKEAYVFIINHESGEPGTLVQLENPGFRIGKITDIGTGQPVAFSNHNGRVAFSILAPIGITRLLRVSPVL
ncbi:hypothetical protein NIASO_15635 [Niabella soli DSM 19437]|uniref:Beta-galactosidase trimerisation domain-containing protein n=2 Tax=Niabella TaxID=379899 RepID=W0F4E9_9BACT|nr:hypothetical protein NIASO_15635 [Niabella soli DSM 19437]